MGRVTRAVENLPGVAAAMPPNRIHAILINRRRRTAISRSETSFFSSPIIASPPEPVASRHERTRDRSANRRKRLNPSVGIILNTIYIQFVHIAARHRIFSRV